MNRKVHLLRKRHGGGQGRGTWTGGGGRGGSCNSQTHSGNGRLTADWSQEVQARTAAQDVHLHLAPHAARRARTAAWAATRRRSTAVQQLGYAITAACGKWGCTCRCAPGPAGCGAWACRWQSRPRTPSAPPRARRAPTPVRLSRMRAVSACVWGGVLIATQRFPH